jgi:Bacteriophage T4-like portal protein (Gp20)
MAWRKYFTTVPNQQQITQRLEQHNRENARAGTTHKFNSFLPEVYAGAPNRVERYVQYDQCDLDSEINRSLDTIAEFCTQYKDENNPTPFRIIYHGDMTESEIDAINTGLQQWCKINMWNKRLFKTFRNTIKYGDQFFIRDPETFELLWVSSEKVEKIIVNEAEGKSIEQYVIRDLDFNMQQLTATNPLIHDNYSFPGGYPRSSNPAAGAGNINYGQPTTPAGRTSRFYNPQNSMAVDGRHVVHLSLSEAMDQYWPFGISVLEAVYKVYKQKDLLEDCILIYRIVRAPERRVFYIDVGQLQGQRAMAYVERIKTEIYQRRLPNKTGGGQCIDLDTKIPLLDGRTLQLRSIIEEFDVGKQNWVYSINPETGRIVPGLITWAGITRKNTHVIRLTLDNGQTIVCTPDHKVPVIGRGKIEAREIRVNQDLLFGFTSRTVEDGEKSYREVYDHNKSTWIRPSDMIDNLTDETGIAMDQVSLNFVKHGDSQVYQQNADSPVMNHLVTRLEWLEERQDTGTITVDGAELLHDYHTFATDSGIFVYNSVLDTAYNPISITEDFFLATNAEQRGNRIDTLPAGENLGCFSLDTQIKLLDGRDLSIRDIAAEISMGKTLWTYSCHPVTGEIAPGIISWAGKTRSDANVMRLTLDTGETITCTPDHKFPLRGIGFVQASELKLGQSLLALYLRDGVVSQEYFDHSAQDWLSTDNLHSKTTDHVTYTPASVFSESLAQSALNHTITQIEYLDETMDVGTLTVDGDEQFHDWHTYALSVGVFVKNSLDDLKYFNNKLMRGLGIPSSYLPTGPDDGQTVYNDGKVATAFIQEYRFNKYCQRLQSSIAPTLDREFKLFLKNRGIEVSANLFDLAFNPPQSFSEYRMMALDTERANLFNTVMSSDAQKYMSKRFALMKYLGLTEDEVLENEKLWKEENSKRVQDKTGVGPLDAEKPGLGAIGIKPTTAEEEPAGMGEPPGGEPGGGPEMPGAETAGAGAPPPAELGTGGAPPPVSP